MLSKLTIAGLHNYTNGALWDNLELPEGIDKELFINEVLRQASEFSLVYPNLDFMKYQIGTFSKKWYHNFERWYKAYNFEYEALYNLDVKNTIIESAKDTDNDLKHFDMNRNGTSGGTSNGRNGALSDRSKAAYDATSTQPVERNSDSSNSSLSSSETHSESEYHSESNSHSWEHSQTIEEYRRGNQGITMSQEMLLAEYNAWMFNLYEHMAEIFVCEFCICIYN